MTTITTTTALTYEDAKARLGKLAAERPDFVYERVLVPLVVDEDGDDERGGYEECRYFDIAGQPSCIVGHAYAAELRELLATGEPVEGASASPLLASLGADRRAQMLADRVQGLQDRGTPWGEAFATAVAWVEDNA